MDWPVDTVIVAVAVLPASNGIDDGEKLAEDPAGRPLALSATAPEKPPVDVAVTT